MSNGLVQPSAPAKYKGGEKDTVLLFIQYSWDVFTQENKYKGKTLATYKSMDRE